MQLRIFCADGSGYAREVSGRLIRLGRDAACEVSFDPTQFPKVSGLHAQIEHTPAGTFLTHKSQSNKTLVNDSPIDETVPLRIGDRIRLGFTGPTIQVIALSKNKPVQDFSATIQSDAAHLALLRGTAESEEFEIGIGGIIGRDPTAQFVLDHPHVSRQHAQLTTGGDRVVITDLRSANGTFVNGLCLKRSTELEPGDRIEIGPFSLGFDGHTLVSRSRSNNVELVACGLTRVVTGNSTDQEIILIDDISLVIHPREFVCVIGPSGSGKSTLLAMLSGRTDPDEGLVLVNGRDSHADFAALKQDIAVVPQTEALHRNLSVESALRYTAELRLPPDTSSEETDRAVEDLLAVVGLTHRRDTAIHQLSGGELKRASLANELISRPSLLCPDKVTSGLDEQSDQEVMEVFRKVADAGKTVVCITHNLVNLEATCHLVIILAEGGRLAFVGTPSEALSYFKIDRLGDVYRAMAVRKPNEWKDEFRASPLYDRYVRSRLPSKKLRSSSANTDIDFGFVRASFFQQVVVLVRRYLAIWRGDALALLTMLGQSLLVGILIAIVLGDLGSVENPVERIRKAVNLLFLLNVSSFWLGCNNAAKELVKERVIYTRERDFNLRADAYLASKLVVLVCIGLFQVTLLYGIVQVCCRPPGSLVGQWVIMTALAVTGSALGLLISTLAKSEEVAIALVPIAIIPQIILAGVIAPLSGLGKALAMLLVTCHWGERALEALLPHDDLQLLSLPDREVLPQLAVIVGHAFVFAALSLVGLFLRDHRGEE